MKRKNLFLFLLLGFFLCSSVYAVEVANPSADYLKAPDYVAGTTAPSAPPTGWSYLYSDAATDGIEVALTAQTAVGNEGNEGFGGPTNFSTPVILGGITGATDFEIFNNSANGGVVGTDLLMHPGNSPATSFVIVRYTVSAADILNGTYATISGNFRRLSTGSSGIIASVYHNSSPLWSVNSVTTPSSDMTVSEGTFNLIGVTVAENDTISFVVDRNGSYNADETALQASIDLEIPPVNDPPTVVTNPIDQDLFIGDDLTLTVFATGTDSLSYQWRKDTVDIIGANSASFNIGSVILGDAGDYDCVVTNTFGTDTSVAATVTVSEMAPVITSDPVSQTLIVGSALNLSVVADGTNPLTYQWAKDIVDIPGATSSTFIIPSVTLEDAGEYDCLVSNNAGNVYSNFAVITVRTNDAPVSSAPDVTTNENTTLTLLVDDLATDADADSITIVSADAISVGGATISFHGSTIAYFPVPDSIITDDTFTCGVSDGFVTTTVTVTVDVVAVSSTVVGDAALDYVDAATLPANWSYFASSEASGGTEFSLMSSTTIGTGENLGYVDSLGQYAVPGILGAIDGGAELEIFADGFEGNPDANAPGHAALEGVDLLLHPGSAAGNDHVIARYTFDGTDITNNGSTATVSGSFRDLNGGTTGGGANSVVAEIYLNGTNIFTVTGAAGRLFEADGTFDIPGFSVSAGDTLSFVVGSNGNLGGDETALRAMISLSMDSPAAGYVTWLSLYPGLTDVLPDDNQDNDNLVNSLEYVFDGDPTVADAGNTNLPDLDESGENFVFTFTRRQESPTDTIQTFEYGSNLTGWASIPIDTGAPEVTLGTPSGGLQTVTVTISKGLAVDGKLFGRLSVIEN